MSHTTYHVARFDHLRAAETMYADLQMLEVKDVTLDAVDREDKSAAGNVWVRVPDGTDLDDHMTAVKNFSLGRGSHTVTREEIPNPNWTPGK